MKVYSCFDVSAVYQVDVPTVCYIGKFTHVLTCLLYMCQCVCVYVRVCMRLE